MANYGYKPSEVQAWFESPAGHALQAKLKKMREAIATTFAALGKADKEECIAVIEEYLQRDEERTTRREEGLIDDDELTEELDADYEALFPLIAPWFPCIADSPEADRGDFLDMFYNYMLERKKAQ